MWAKQAGDSRSADYQTFPNAVTRVIGDKLLLHRLLTKYRLASCAPKTFDVLPDYLHYLKTTKQDVFCFLKISHEAGGIGVMCFKNLRPLLDYLNGQQNTTNAFVIQQGIQNPKLIDGYKFKIRVYVLLTKRWDLYVHDDMLVVLHDEKYDPNSVPLHNLECNGWPYIHP